MGSFNIGKIVGFLELNKKNFESNLTKAKTDVKSFSGHVLRNSKQIKQTGIGMAAVGTGISVGFGLATKAAVTAQKKITETGDSLGALTTRSKENENAIKDVVEKAAESIKKTTLETKEYRIEQLNAEYAEKKAVLELEILEGTAHKDQLLQLERDYRTQLKLALDDTMQYKVGLLNHEYQKERQVLIDNKANKKELAVLEKKHLVQIGKIRTGYRKKWDKIEKADKKEKRAERKEKLEEIKKQEKALSEFISSLKSEQNQLRIGLIRQRQGDRAAETISIKTWYEEQSNLLEQKYSNKLVSQEQYEEAKKLLEDTYRTKLIKAEEDHESKRDYQRGLRLKKINDFIDKWGGAVGNTIGALQKSNEAYTQAKLNNLEKWYQNERQRIIDNVTDESERERQLEELQGQYDSKKASIEAAAARREKALNIAAAIANTAVAVTKAATSAAWPLNIPAILFAAATGAVQLAALGSAYNGPGVGDFNPNVGGGGGGDGGGGGGGGDHSPDVGIGVGGNLPAFAAGTGGWISPPPAAFVGEEGKELLQFEDNRMKITPLGERRISPYRNNYISNHGQEERPLQIIFQINNVLDAAHLDEIIQNKIAPKLEHLFRTGYYGYGVRKG